MRPCGLDLRCYRNHGHTGLHMYPDDPRCHERACENVAAWRVTTAGGNLPFCEEHVVFYRDKGPSIYPVEPIAATIVAQTAQTA